MCFDARSSATNRQSAVNRQPANSRAPASGRLSVYSGLAQWYSALQSGTATMLVIGDSIGQGTAASPETLGFVWLLSQGLGNAYGQRGSTYDYAGLTTLQRSAWTLTGAWTGLAGYGPSEGSTYSVKYANGIANTAEFQAVCTSFDIYYLTGPDTGAGFQVLIDNVSQGTFGATTTAQLTFSKINVPSGQSNTRFLKIVAPADGNVYLFGASGITGATGTLVNNLAVFASATSGWNGTNSLGFMSIMNPDLSLIELGTNDYKSSVPVATFQANLDLIVSRCAGSKFILDTEQLNPSVYSGDRTPYYNAARTVALKYESLYLNIFDHWGSYATADASGYMGDNMHPSTTGHANIAAWLLPYLLNQ